AADAFALERWADAESGFRAVAEAAKTPLDRARATLMIGLSQSHQGEWKAAAASFEAALPDLPLLADTIRYHAARARFFAHDHDAALAHARAVSADSISGADAELLVGDLLRSRGSAEEVRDHYRSY